MVGIFSLWLPILLSAVFVFVASAIVHMVLPHHRSDFKKVPNEDGVMDALRPFNLEPGDYAMPGTGGDMAAAKSDDFKAKLDKGPLIIMTVAPKGSFSSMGSSLAQWFLFCVLVSFFTAYAAELALGSDVDYPRVFRFTATVAFGFHALGQWPRSIWYKSSWTTTLKATADSFLFGLLTGGTFGWLWP